MLNYVENQLDLSLFYALMLIVILLIFKILIYELAQF